MRLRARNIPLRSGLAGLGVAVLAAAGLAVTPATGSAGAEAGRAAGSVPVVAPATQPNSGPDVKPVAATAGDPDGPTTTIVGGDPADQVYPGVASLQLTHPATGEQDFHICGAWQFSGYWVVTNAHCVTDEFGNPYPVEWNLHLRVGSNNRTTGGQVAAVTAVIPHYDWAWGAIPGLPVSDIAMLRVDRYLDLPALVIPARLPKVGSPVRVVGWGLTEPSSNEGPVPTRLRQLDVKLLAGSRCTAPVLGITAGEICVSNARGTDGICYGDSGSPVLWQEKVGGAVRWRGLGGASRVIEEPLCGTSPAIYTDAVAFRSWIYEVARTGANPQPVTKRPPGNLRLASGLAWRDFDLAG